MAESQPAFDPLVDKAPARFVVGIDLGTTNSALMFVDTEESDWRVQSLPIPQLVADHQIESRDTLPSFHFQCHPTRAEDGALRLAWDTAHPDFCVGVMAREEGMKSPDRLIASAKSWLCHTGIDRSAQSLPWQGAADVARLSPVEVSARYLDHLRRAWNHSFPQHPLPDQDLVITLPASFDEVARELTVEAAAQAGLPNVVLIEEPQAAFYAWVYLHTENWSQLVSAGDTILVCDIGGGTSDFTLIKVRPTDEADEGRVQFHRIAVGDHLILGGDNLDLTLAQHIETKLAEHGPLNARQWDVLVRSCRRVKETLLGQDPPEEATVNLPGTGSKVIGGGIQARISQSEAEELLAGGFLPSVALGEAPREGQSGFREFGLPYASDPAITRHLAAFLTAHGQLANQDQDSTLIAARPDVVLFNGGFFASPQLRARLLEAIEAWFHSPSSEWAPRVLEHDRLDLAVARGAAYYGMVRRGEGIRIAASLARSYYVAVEDGAAGTQVICLVPGHAEPGQDIHLDQLKLELAVAQPVEFSLFVSSTRLTDEPGDILPLDREHMRPLPPIRTVLRTERRNKKDSIPVSLHAHLSEIGTIDLWCQSEDGAHRWRLQFDVRSATQTDHGNTDSHAEQEGLVDEATWEACEACIAKVFGDDATGKPGELVQQLASALGTPRDEWPTSLLRRIWESLMDRREGRRRSPAHEARWLNLVGFALRPGYGLAVDDWRVVETWRHVRGKLVHAGASKAESLILWRRVAGGLSKGQQVALAEPILAALRAAHASATRGKKAKANAAFPMHESSEAWRLLGSLELLDVALKEQIGTMIIELLGRPKFSKVANSMVWALGRIGQRLPLYGPLNLVVPVNQTTAWTDALLQHDVWESSHLAAMQLNRKTGDRHRDVSDEQRERVAEWLQATNAPAHLRELVTTGGELGGNEQAQVFGEALPKGFRLSQN